MLHKRLSIKTSDKRLRNI